MTELASRKGGFGQGVLDCSIGNFHSKWLKEKPLKRNNRRLGKVPFTVAGR